MTGHKDQQEHVADESIEQPVCLRCLKPFDSLQHYCEHCGEGVGTLTPYIPFVNIRYNYSIFSRMWQWFWSKKKAAWPMRPFFLILIVLFAPIMFLGLPFVWWDYLKKKQIGNSDECC